MICDKNQYGEASFWDILKLQLHFLRCKICSLYTKQNMFLSKIYKNQAKSCKEYRHNLTTYDKEKLQKELDKMSS